MLRSGEEAVNLNMKWNPWSDAFATDLIGFNDDKPLSDVKWWISGHTHYTTSCTRNGVRLVSNQCGYFLRPPGAKIGPSAILATDLYIRLWSF